MVFTHKKTLFTWFGKNSLVLYISHAAVIQLLTLRPILKYGSWSQLILSEAFIVIVLLVLAIIIKKITSYAKSIKVHDINDLNQQT
jgi:fucose 4-O-acetylase-like acetyltransferase